MAGWFDQIHGISAAFSPTVTAVKLAVAIAIGLVIGFERQWSHKDFGVRTFSFRPRNIAERPLQTLLALHRKCLLSLLPP